MGPRLLVEVKDLKDVNYVKLSGVVDEDNDLAEITGQITKSNVLIDTSDIDRINSCGVRDWVTWLGDVDKKGCTIWLMECSPAIMTQINLVNNFLGNSKIVSFYAPYYRDCDLTDCVPDKMLLIQTKDAQATKPYKAPSCRCEQCDHLLEFDDIETSYFGFLSTVESINVSPEVEKAIDEVSNNKSGTIRTRRTAVTPYSGSGSKTDGGGSQVTSSTTPSTKDLGGLLTPPPTVGGGTQANIPVQSGSNTTTVLYVVVGLLIVAIGILGYIVVTRT